MIRVLGITLVTLALLAGCAATVQRQGVADAAIVHPGRPLKHLILLVQGGKEVQASADWYRLRSEWRSAMTSATAGAGAAFTYWDSEPQSPSESGTLVVVKVNTYRYVSTEARVAFGVFTGEASIDVEATFYELPGRDLIATRRYTTASSRWQGILAPMTGRQVEAIAKEIVEDLRRS